MSELKRGYEKAMEAIDEIAADEAEIAEDRERLISVQVPIGLAFNLFFCVHLYVTEREKALNAMLGMKLLPDKYLKNDVEQARRLHKILEDQFKFESKPAEEADKL